MLEIGIAVLVVGVLLTLSFPVFAKLRARAQRVQCTSNLRNLYLGANLFLQENGSWPQISMGGNPDTPEGDYANAWIAALTPFGPTQKTWICPTIQGLLQNPDLSQPENVRTDYIATPFDSKPLSPREWPRQPWFAETADVHGNGNLIVFTDGSVSDLKTVLQNQGGR